MANAVSIATWFLALVFGWSGASKLYNPAPAAEAIVHFGVAKTARPLLGRLLGTLELGLAVLLAFQLATRVALAGSLLLLAIFVVLIGRSLRRGDRFDCACFVGMEGAVSRSTLARSFALTVISLALLTLEVVGISRAAGWPEEAFAAGVAYALLGSVILAALLPRTLVAIGENR